MSEDPVTGLTAAELAALDAHPDSLDTPGRIARGEARSTRAAIAFDIVTDYVDVPDHVRDALIDALVEALPEDPPHTVRVTIGRSAMLRLTRDAARMGVSRDALLRRRVGGMP
jgi:hypothetical protein